MIVLFLLQACQPAQPVTPSAAPIEPTEIPEIEIVEEPTEEPVATKKRASGYEDDDKYKPGDTIELF